ncbi:MAG: hypothetical protein FRX49_08363 [Trebouxia sp. A1-2]|nr:MAG: hypothetical protein FRX49_08363 [Trebouxia sp. A1-2]
MSSLGLKGAMPSLAAASRVLFYLPVASVHYVAVLAAQDEAAAVGDGVCHPQWRTPEARKMPGNYASAHQLHGEGTSIDGSVGVKCWDYLQARSDGMLSQEKHEPSINEDVSVIDANQHAVHANFTQAPYWQDPKGRTLTRWGPRERLLPL